MNIDEAAAAFGQPVSRIEAVARGRKLKGKETLPVPKSFDVRRRRFIGRHDKAYTVVDRRELWGDGRMIWAIQHADQLFETRVEAERQLNSE